MMGEGDPYRVIIDEEGEYIFIPNVVTETISEPALYARRRACRETEAAERRARRRRALSWALLLFVVAAMVVVLTGCQDDERERSGQLNPAGKREGRGWAVWDAGDVIVQNALPIRVVVVGPVRCIVEPPPPESGEFDQ